MRGGGGGGGMDTRGEVEWLTEVATRCFLSLYPIHPPPHTVLLISSSKVDLDVAQDNAIPITPRETMNPKPT